jgi:anti-sigma factor RsiW
VHVTPTESLTCQQVVELVTAYLERALPAPARARFERHLAECDPCDTYLRQMRQTIRWLRTAVVETIPSETKAGLVAMFRSWKHASRD